MPKDRFDGKKDLDDLLWTKPSAKPAEIFLPLEPRPPLDDLLRTKPPAKPAEPAKPAKTFLLPDRRDFLLDPEVEAGSAETFHLPPVPRSYLNDLLKFDIGYRKCAACDGTGKQKCVSCNGFGKIKQKRTHVWFPTGRPTRRGLSYKTREYVTCPSCHGSGRLYQCIHCRGNGRIAR